MARADDAIAKILNSDPDKLPNFDELTAAEREEIIDIWTDYSIHGISIPQIVAKRARDSKARLVAPSEAARAIEIAAGWIRLNGGGVVAVVMGEKARTGQRIALEEINRVHEQLQAGGGVGLPRKTIKIKRKPKKGETVTADELHRIEAVEFVEETMSYADATGPLTAAMNQLAKFQQLEMIALGVQKLSAESNAPTKITIEMPTFDRNIFTTRPVPPKTIEANGSNGKKNTNGRNGNGTD